MEYLPNFNFKQVLKFLISKLEGNFYSAQYLHYFEWMITSAYYKILYFFKSSCLTLNEHYWDDSLLLKQNVKSEVIYSMKNLYILTALHKMILSSLVSLPSAVRYNSFLRCFAKDLLPKQASIYQYNNNSDTKDFLNQ